MNSWRAIYSTMSSLIGFSLSVVLLVQVFSSVHAYAAPDSDGDGIVDTREDELLYRFRPYFRFSIDGHEEYYRPTDVQWYIEHSELLWDGTENYGLYGQIPNSALKDDPTLILTADRIGSEWGSSDLTKNAETTKYYINIYNEPDDYRDGFENGDGHDWPEIIATGNVGLYGHVVPYGPLVKIEYWQFFGHNRPDVFLDFGDHEGDWVVLALLYDPLDDRIVKVFHYAHGKEMAFELTLVQDTIALTPEEVELRGPNYSTLCYNIDQPHIVNEVQNNLLRLRRDGTSGRFEHPVVYLERGSHEGFPSEYWCYPQAPKHNGTGYSFLCGAPMNLGEVLAPANDIARVILRYNGKWGAYSNNNANPHGPALHTEWTWPENDVLHASMRSAIFEDFATSWHFGPPFARAGPDTTVECTGPEGTLVQLRALDVYDRDDDIVRFEWLIDGKSVGAIPDLPVRLHVGRYRMDLICTDRGNSASPDGLSSHDIAWLQVADSEPPALLVTVSPRQLWPPNHKLRPVVASVLAHDRCDGSDEPITLVQVTSSQPPDAKNGDGTTSPDIVGADIGDPDFGMLLRAERQGNVTREYVLTYAAQDAAKNQAIKADTVRVPASLGARALQVGPNATSEPTAQWRAFVENAGCLMIEYGSGVDANAAWQVFDVSGRLVGSVAAYPDGSSGRLRIAGSTKWPSGVYLVRVTEPRGARSKKVLILR